MFRVTSIEHWIKIVGPLLSLMHVIALLTECQWNMVYWKSKTVTMLPEYSIGMDSMSISVGVCPSGDILHPPQQAKEYSLELAECQQTCKCSGELYCVYHHHPSLYEIILTRTYLLVYYKTSHSLKVYQFCNLKSVKCATWLDEAIYVRQNYDLHNCNSVPVMSHMQRVWYRSGHRWLHLQRYGSWTQ